MQHVQLMLRADEVLSPDKLLSADDLLSAGKLLPAGDLLRAECPASDATEAGDGPGSTQGADPGTA